MWNRQFSFNCHVCIHEQHAYAHYACVCVCVCVCIPIYSIYMRVGVCMCIVALPEKARDVPSCKMCECACDGCMYVSQPTPAWSHIRQFHHPCMWYMCMYLSKQLPDLASGSNVCYAKVLFGDIVFTLGALFSFFFLLLEKKTLFTLCDAGSPFF